MSYYTTPEAKWKDYYEHEREITRDLLAALKALRAAWRLAMDEGCCVGLDSSCAPRAVHAVEAAETLADDAIANAEDSL